MISSSRTLDSVSNGMFSLMNGWVRWAMAGWSLLDIFGWLAIGLITYALLVWAKLAFSGRLMQFAWVRYREYERRTSAEPAANLKQFDDATKKPDRDDFMEPEMTGLQSEFIHGQLFNEKQPPKQYPEYDILPVREATKEERHIIDLMNQFQAEMKASVFYLQQPAVPHDIIRAKQTCTDILHMASLRAQMEEDLGKKLTKLARSGLGTEEVGETKNALRTVRAEMENNAKAHLELAKQLRLEIEKPLSSFIADQRNKRRSQTSIIQKTEGDRNALRSQLRKLQDKRRSDTKKVGDLDLQVNGLQSSGDPKLRAKLERAQMQQKATENEYNDVRERLKEADSQWFNVWRSACDVFQVLEEERIEYLKTVLWTYTNLVSSCCVADDESMERIRQDLEKISVADDIAEFIHTFGTGAPDPELARKYGITLQTDDNADERQKQPAQLDSDDEQSIRIPTQRSFQQQPPKQQQPSSAMSAPVNSNTVNSMSTSSGTARSGSILAHPVSRPQTQESVRQYPMQQPQQQRPASMHAQQMQPQPMMNGRPASSMHGHVSADNTYRRASNNDMYAMANGAQPQYIQRTNSQMAMRSNEPPAGYMYVNAMDPRAPSSMGAYHSNGGTNSPVLIPAQQMQPHHPQRPGTPSQVGANGSSAVPQRMESPRSRAGTFNGPAHTGNFGTLTGNPQMQPFPPHHHQPPNSSPGSPYQQAMNGGSGNGSRPSSSMGMQNNMGGSPHMIPINPASGNIEAKDITGQTEQVLKNLEAILVASGSSISNVVKTTCFLDDINEWPAMNEVYGKVFHTDPPARSAFEVGKLPKNAKVEVEAIAKLNED
ncbi:formin-binding protein [Coemansia sp. RSA 1290]|nr:formin-binding protein [Coemansia sp. RSA 1290]